MTIRFFESPQTGIVIVSMSAGDYLLEGISEVARSANIHSGVLMTGIGSLSFARIHAVVTNHPPYQDLYYDLEGPVEIVGFRGIIASFEPHIHISLMDKNGRMIGGHLEDGCSILTLSEISILRLPDLNLARRALPGDTIRLLDME
ncbi:MAG TPA: PPC domain-containing DNA-binding protein [Anaerolineaceae bacterium]